MPGINLQQGPCIYLDLELILGKPKTAIACFGAGDAFIYVSTDGTAYGSTTARLWSRLVNLHLPLRK